LVQDVKEILEVILRLSEKYITFSRFI